MAEREYRLARFEATSIKSELDREVLKKRVRNTAFKRTMHTMRTAYSQNAPGRLICFRKCGNRLLGGFHRPDQSRVALQLGG